MLQSILAYKILIRILSGVAGERIFDFFTPGEIGHHFVLFTYSMLFVCFIVFFYMIGAYPFYKYLSDPSIGTCVTSPKSPAGRTLFVHWMFPRVRLFPFATLILPASSKMLHVQDTGLYLQAICNYILSLVQPALRRPSYTASLMVRAMCKLKVLFGTFC